MQKPTVSVIIPSYNHGPYIARAIQSVLDQTYTDFELIISDDASKDDSAQIIRSFDDKRIKAFFQEKNLGAVGAIEFLNQQAKGKYIALLNSDDYWAPKKLEKQVTYMEAHPETGVCFTQGVMVDENEKVLTELDSPLAYIFVQKNKTQAKWLRYFWDAGNALSHMSILARHDIYAKEFFFNPALRQLPDFDMWTRIVQKYAIHVVPKTLFYHRRLLKEHANTSAETSDNAIRGLTEEAWVSGRMIQTMSDEHFKEGFSDLFRNKDAQSHVQLQCERFFLLQKHRFGTPLKLVAQNYFLTCALDKEFIDCMKNEYNYSLNDFFDFSGKAIFANEAQAMWTENGMSSSQISNEYVQCRIELETIKNSACWRMTKPIRALFDFIKRHK